MLFWVNLIYGNLVHNVYDVSILFIEYDCKVFIKVIMGQSYLWTFMACYCKILFMEI
jgi:hypothetical protein